MKSTIADGILSVCSALKNHGVQYLIVWGTAVAIHGYFRWSYHPSGLKAEKFDLDFWFNPTYENYFNLLNALPELGHDVSPFLKEQSPNPGKSFFRFEGEKFTIDFLPSLKGLTNFGDAFKKKDLVDLNGIEIWVLSFDDLIKDKSANPRPKDIKDVQKLSTKRDKKKE